MKKFFKSVFVAMAIVATGAVTTSCDEDSPWLGAITDVLVGILGGINGDAELVYTGTATISMYNYSSTNNTYNQDSRQTVAPMVEISVVTEDGTNGEHGFVQFTIKTPIVVNGTSVKDVVFTTYYDDKTGKIDPDGQTYLTGGTCTYNGTAETAINAACFEGAKTDSQLLLSNIYFQVGDKLFMGSFKGDVKTASAE